MLNSPIIKRLIFGFAAITLVSACTARSEKSGTFVVPSEPEGRIVIDTDGFAGALPTRVHFFDRMEKEEYTLFRSDAGQTEILYAETRPDMEPQVVLDFDKLISDTVRMWRFHQGETLKFDESFSVTNRIGEFWINTFSHAETGRQCFGFSSRWDTRYDDREYRPSKILFGYHCAPTGKTLSPSDPERIIQALDIRGVSVPLRIVSAYDAGKEHPLPPRDTQVANLVIAQDGIGGGVSGLPNFPLLVARQFTDKDAGCVTC